MAARLGRLKKEIKQLQDSPPPGVSCWPEGDQLTIFSGVIIGEEDTVYNGGVFKLEIEIPEKYPFLPPSVRFLTKIYHPNIDTAGRICLDVLKMPPSGSWRPLHNLSTIMTSIRLLMQVPNPDDPLMTDIADEYRFRKSQFEATAREWTKQFAMENVCSENIVITKSDLTDESSGESRESSSSSSAEATSSGTAAAAAAAAVSDVDNSNRQPKKKMKTSSN